MTKSTLNKISAAIGVAVLATSKLSAGTYVVTTTADSGPGSLRQAILSANAGCGGDITFYKVSGTIGLQSSLPAITQSVTILGPGESKLTVSGSSEFSVFSIGAGVCGTISGLTIANGSAQGSFAANSSEALGSGIANAGQIEVRNCVIENCLNFLSEGGAVYNSGTLQLNNCTVANSGSLGEFGEEAQVRGGGIFNSGNLIVNDCTISNCVASQGGGIFNSGSAEVKNSLVTACRDDNSEGDAGGIYNSAGSLLIHRSTISGCAGGFDGGAIVSFASLIVRDTTISGNNALEGGGVFLAGGTNLFHNCTISSNNDFGFGGGGIKNLAQLTLLACTISGNRSGYGGGGIENLNVLEMTNCTVSGNSCTAATKSDPGAGGILNTTNDIAELPPAVSAMLYLTDCTIASNTAAAGPSGGVINEPGSAAFVKTTIIADNGFNDFSGVFDSEGSNLVKGTNNCMFTGTLTGNLCGVDPLLGPLQNNGGLTFTEALLPGSPAIGAGPVGGLPRFDQRGVMRPRTIAGDIGAYEATTNNAHFVTLTPAGRGFQVSLNGTPGVNYAIQRASSPNGPWTTLTNLTTGPDGMGACMDYPAGQSGFYRSALP